MKPLIKNQKIRVDNHGGANNDFSKVHIDKTNYDYHGARCKIYFDSGRVEWVNCPDDLRDKIIREIAGSLEDNGRLKEFGKSLAKKVYEWKNKRVTEEIAIAYAKEIAGALGLRDEISARMAQHVGNALRRMLTIHRDDEAKYYIDQSGAGIEVGEFKEKRIYFK